MATDIKQLLKESEDVLQAMKDGVLFTHPQAILKRITDIATAIQPTPENDLKQVDHEEINAIIGNMSEIRQLAQDVTPAIALQKIKEARNAKK